MISKMAMLDLENLREQGINPTPEEIIRLNAFGLRHQRGPTTGDVTAAPRIGWAGHVPIFEPTIQSDHWTNNFAARWFDGDEYASALLFACAHAAVTGFFTRPCMLSPTGVREEMRAWQAGLAATEKQLKEALHYALLGTDPAEESPSDKAEAAADPFPAWESPHFRTLDMVDEAIAAQLGLSLDDLSVLTHSRLLSILRKWQINQGWTSQRADLKAQRDYTLTLKAIIAAHQPQKEPACE